MAGSGCRAVAGRGTLIVEHRSPKGPIREWWTPDEVIESAPFPLPATSSNLLRKDQLEAFAKYAAACASKYTDVSTGSASLTEVPKAIVCEFGPEYVVADLGGQTPARFLIVKGRNLHQTYPIAKIVTLLAWTERPMLMRGDAEAVFLAAE